MRHVIRHATWTFALLAAMGQPSAFAQTPAQSDAGVVRRLSVDDAVKLALEQNLGIQIDRLNPQIQDISVAQARTGWIPNLTSSLTNNSQNSPPTSALSGGQTKVVDGQFATAIGLAQTLKTGANYSLSWNSARQTSTNLFTNFEPLLSSNVAFSITQPLLQNYKIDNLRATLETTRKDREAADIQLQSTIVATTRNVKNAYWDLAYNIDNLKAQQQSLDLAKRLLADNEKRVQIGTMAPIDIVEAQSEVARNEESVIVAEAAIKQAEDRLRALILDPKMPDFWTVGLEPSDAMPFTPQAVDVNDAVRKAIANRTDIQASKTSLERNDVSIRFFRNQILPQVNATASYRSNAVGGVFLSPVSLTSLGSPRSVVGTAGVRLGAGRHPHQHVPDVDGRSHAVLSARHELAGNQSRAGQIAVRAGRDAAQRSRDAGHDAGARCRASGADEPEARRQRTGGARVGGTAARGGGKEIRRRHSDQFLRVPGAARSGDRTNVRNPRHCGLQQVGGGFRGRSGNAVAVDLPSLDLGL